MDPNRAAMVRRHETYRGHPVTFMDWSRYYPSSLSDREGLLLGRAAILAAMALILYLGVGIFYKAITLPLARAKPAVAAEARSRTAIPKIREAAEVYQAIPERNLFGTAVNPDPAKSAEVTERDLAQFLELKGTIAGDGGSGFAIVEEKGNQRQSLARVGDVVAGAKVLRVHRHSADFLLDGREKTLKVVEAPQSILPQAAGRGPVGPPPPR